MQIHNYLRNIFLLLLLSATMSAQSGDAISIPLSIPNKPGILELGLVNGSIFVTGYNGNVVLVETKTKKDFSHKDCDIKKPKHNGLKKISNGREHDLIIQEKNNLVEIHFEIPPSDINVYVKVPKDFSVHLSTVNDGDIIVENVNGNHEISNINGAIELTGIGGSVVANCLNHDIHVSFTSVSSDTPMAFTTLNGDVDISFPANVKASIKAKSDNGDVYSDFDIIVSNKSVKKQMKEKSDQLHKYNIDDWVEGDINGGGQEIMLKTLNGDVIIRKTM